jgi:PAS domain S-box-containing protein
LTDFLPISIFEVDAAGSIISFNRTALEVFRYNKEDYKEGMNALQFFPPEEWQRVGENMRKVIQGASIPGQEYNFLRKDGSTFIGLIYASPNIYQDKIVGIIGAIIDVTEQKRAEGERKRLEERLQRAEKMEALGTLAGGVAHDLNNVIGVLMGYSELLLQNVPQESPFKRHAMQIFKGSQRAAAIIQDLLTLTRRGVLVSETLNLNRVISDFLQTPEFDAIKSHHPGVQFRTSLDAELLNIKGSSTHLSKTVMNLLSNAAESISGSGEVLIRTENLYVDRQIHGYDTTQEGEYAVLTVSDTGSGISPADLGRIFEPFYTKKVMGRSGTGLGLAVVWGTVKDHDGHIDVQSTEGEGTIFTLYFPVTREALTKFEQAVARDTYLGHGERILIVDDMEGQRLLASAMLDSLGYKVSSVASGEEAIDFVKNKPVDLIIMDMIMDPGMDGLDTYRSILEIHPKQKAIIVSGFSETDRVHAAQSLGAGAYIRKPYVIEKLGVAVRKELNRST